MTTSTPEFLAVAATNPLVQGVDRIRCLKPLLQAGQPQPAALFLLYNLARGCELQRGFTPARGRGVNTHLALRQAAEQAPALAKACGLELTDAEAASLTTLRRQLYVQDFEASCAPGQFDAPAVQGALWHAMRLTPHGPADTQGRWASGAFGHGLDCWKRYHLMVCALLQGRAIAGAPAWLSQYGKLLLPRLRPLAEMQDYLVSHDCGKAAVMTRDAKGRLHFPGHAEKSAQLWRLARKPEAQAKLMELDMALHTLPVSEMAEFSQHYLAPSLLLATQAQLFSNAATIFGGLESASYRKKQAALDARAQALIQHWGLLAAAATVG